MTRTNLSLALPTLVSLLALAACIPPSADPGGEAGTDTDADPDPGADDATSDPGALTTGADDGSPGDEGDAGTDAGADEAGEDATAGEPPADDGDGGGLACDPTTHACLSALPAGWAGPTTLTKTGADEPLPSCEGAWSETFHQDLFAGFDDGGDATCTCGCYPENLSCELEASLSYWDAYACSGAPDGTLLVEQGVHLGNPAWIDDPDGVWRVNWSEQTLVGDCAPASSETIPEATFATRITACGLPHDPADTCGFGDVCTPRPSESSSGEVCIFNEGEHECPAGDYSERKVYYRDIEDTRACPDCECGEVSGSCTEEHFTPGFYDGEPTNIAWDNEQILLSGACDLVILQNGAFNALSVVPGEPVGGGLFAQCGEIPGSEVPYGQATPSSAVTFCCTEL